MRIGVAFSGCDLGGISAYSVLKELESQGFEIGMISASCIPSAAALLYARGYDEPTARRVSESFISDALESDIDCAIANLSDSFKAGVERRIPIAINSVNVHDGTIATFTDEPALRSSRLRTFGIDDIYDALSATISLKDGLGSYRYENLRLCDFCCWYGCPVHQLKLSGFDKIISAAFVPRIPKTPYEVLVKRMISSTPASAVLHIPIEFSSGVRTLDQYSEIAKKKIKSFASQILFKTLF